MNTLRQVWNQDTILEAMTERNPPKARRSRLWGLVFKLGSAAAVVASCIELTIVNQQWQSAEATIQANRAALAEPAIVTPADVAPPLEIVERDKGESAASQVAETEPPRSAESSSSGLDAATAPKSPPHTRFGFDLEHGTPMPPDSREAKPVY